MSEEHWTPELKDTEEDQLRRLDMIKHQITSRGVDDPAVLDALARVPRHFFLPPEYRDKAYEDRAVPIGWEQTISQPFIVALMTQSLEVKPGKKILDIGTGSGYQAAILAAMGAELTSIERIPALHKTAEKLLEDMGYEVNCLLGDGTAILPEGETFDGIVVAAAAPDVPQIYLERLNPGGILVIPVGNRREQLLKKFVRDDSGWRETTLIRCVFVPLIGAYGFSETGDND